MGCSWPSSCFAEPTGNAISPGATVESSKLRQKWDALISGEIPYEAWRKNPFDRRIVESIALDAFEAAGAEESARLLKFLRASGLIEKRIFEARQLTGWRRMRALVALGGPGA